MRKPVSLVLLAVLAWAAAAIGTTPPANAEEVIQAVSPFPRKFIFNRNFFTYIEAVNKAGAGIVRINYKGGREIMPGRKQQQAVARGVLDMVWGPATYYLGTIPQVYAMLGSNLSPMEVRANGGFDMLDAAWRRKLNSHLLGWMLGGIGYNLYLKDAPKITRDGLVDLSGLKIRIAPTYREFFTGMGGTTIRIKISEVYTALERGVVQGLGWPEIGINDFGWQKFVRYQIAPPFLQTALVVAINQDKWASMPKAARDIVTRISVAHEKASHDFIRAEVSRQNAIARKNGIKLVTLPGAGPRKYRAAAAEAVWSKLRQRLPKQAAALRSRFTRPE